MSRSERICWIEAQIKRELYPNADSVAERFGVTRRTAFEDSKYLRERCNAPLEFNKERRGWYYTCRTFSLPFLALDEQEASILRRSLLAAKEYLGPADAEAVARVVQLLNPYLVSSPGAEHEQIRGAVHLTGAISSSLAGDCDIAIRDRRRLHILYYGPRRNDLTERVIQPYDMLVWRGEPHLVSFCELRQAIRQFFLGRIREWRLLPGDAAFVRDPDFKIEDYAGRGFDLLHGAHLITVKARFSAYQSRWIRERRYHESQQTEELPDGRLVLSLQVAGFEEVRRWLMSYGGEVEVLEPPELRAEIVQELQRLRKIYADPDE